MKYNSFFNLIYNFISHRKVSNAAFISLAIYCGVSESATHAMQKATSLPSDETESVHIAVSGKQKGDGINYAGGISFLRQVLNLRVKNAVSFASTLPPDKKDKKIKKDLKNPLEIKLSFSRAHDITIKMQLQENTFTYITEMEQNNCHIVLAPSPLQPGHICLENGQFRNRPFTNPESGKTWMCVGSTYSRMRANGKPGLRGIKITNAELLNGFNIEDACNMYSSKQEEARENIAKVVVAVAEAARFREISKAVENGTFEIPEKSSIDREKKIKLILDEMHADTQKDCKNQATIAGDKATKEILDLVEKMGGSSDRQLIRKGLELKYMQLGNEHQAQADIELENDYESALASRYSKLNKKIIELLENIRKAENQFQIAETRLIEAKNNNSIIQTNSTDQTEKSAAIKNVLRAQDNLAEEKDNVNNIKIAFISELDNLKSFTNDFKDDFLLALIMRWSTFWSPERRLDNLVFLNKLDLFQ